MKFKDLKLSTPLINALESMGYETPTEIQQLAIPYLLSSNGDFVGQAQTGTGKTAAFSIPLIEYLAVEANPLSALILAPTRELAHQIAEEIEKLAKYTKLKTVVVVGGESYDKQISKIKSKKANIVVGTPGRVLDLMDRKVLDFKNAKYLILDEADEMLKMGFYEEIQLVISNFNRQRNFWMFSATMPKPIAQLIKRELKNPEFVNVSPGTGSKKDIEQKLFLVKDRFHLEALTRIIDSEDDIYAMVFCQTKRQCDEFGSDLLARGYKVEVLHGDMGQAQRNRIMTSFKARKVSLLICTDVAARGIDISNLTHVINLGIPREIENYIHRIGRTGRAGEKGKAYSIVDVKDMVKVKRIESHTGNKIEIQKLPSVDSMKKSLVQNELEKMETLVSAIAGKKDAFKIDNTFDLYSEQLGHLSKQEILKLSFSWMFNRDLRRFDDLAHIEQNIGERIIKKGVRKKRGFSGAKNHKRSRPQRKNR